MADIEAGLEKIEEKIESGEKLSPEEQKLLNETPEDKGAKQADDEQVDPEELKIAKEESEPAKDSKASDTPDEKDEGSSPSKENEEDTAASEAERKKLIEEEAEKPLDEADIKDYSPTERALFFELRKERRKRQESQAEADTLKFERAKDEARKQIERERVAADEKAKAEKEQDPFDGMEDDDLLTAGQLKKLMATKKEAPKTAPEEQARANNLLLENWTLKAQIKLPDVDLQLVTKLADEVLMRNGTRDPDAAAEVDDVVSKGGNPLIATYNFLRSHPKYGPMLEERLSGKKPEEAKKSDEEARTNKDRAKRIEENKKKPVTTGSGGGAPASGEYTVQELLDMPEESFAKLPKSQRNRILETF